jgi:prepilin-type N-terminal cleavage/methylation domain-containing protein
MMFNPIHLHDAFRRRAHREPRRGFTLVEMLIATAVTLLLMLALARAFGFVGRKVQEGRGETVLSNTLRDITTRLSDELDQCTVTLEPVTGGEDPLGYLLYYEGPVTNATSALFRAINDSTGNLDLGDTKWGDFDDYLAFTAVAQGNNWFVGKVPRYLLDLKTLEQNGISPSTYTIDANSFDPVVIRSKYAEIVYFASPEYAPASMPATPTYIDVDGDLDLGSGSAI